MFFLPALTTGAWAALAANFHMSLIPLHCDSVFHLSHAPSSRDRGPSLPRPPSRDCFSVQEQHRGEQTQLVHSLQKMAELLPLQAEERFQRKFAQVTDAFLEEETGNSKRQYVVGRLRQLAFSERKSSKRKRPLGAHSSYCLYSLSHRRKAEMEGPDAELYENLQEREQVFSALVQRLEEHRYASYRSNC